MNIITKAAFISTSAVLLSNGMVIDGVHVPGLKTIAIAAFREGVRIEAQILQLVYDESARQGALPRLPYSDVDPTMASVPPEWLPGAAPGGYSSATTVPRPQDRGEPIFSP